MGYDLHMRCLTHGETARASRSYEAAAIRIWMKRHPDRTCVLEWAVDNSYSAPAWVDEDPDLCLPDDLPASARPRAAGSGMLMERG